MGFGIKTIRRFIENIAKEKPFFLSLGGLFLTLSITFISGFTGWILERLIFQDQIHIQILGYIILTISLSSSIAYTCLRKSVIEVLSYIEKIPINKQNLTFAREKLNEIVGRDTKDLDKKEILRATAESASENSVDGVFAPLFWMFFGSLLWKFSTDLPGPLA